MAWAGTIVSFAFVWVVGPQLSQLRHIDPIITEMMKWMLLSPLLVAVLAVCATSWRLWSTERSAED